uniref:Transcription factor protein n=1 Tax=Ciona intestinalis TaxID=7719 RepID=F6Q678_CIOIN|nr:transcription factor protein isoform X1 [Ciona intestinalis]|eukprot:XP_026694096.1 transcription factor protein isoform X1 [Ciona intestinalis]
MNNAVRKKLRRSEIHERLKQNYEALYARCPPLGPNKEMLDDSLTNLQWLWNLNVSMTFPIEINKGEKNGKPAKQQARQEHEASPSKPQCEKYFNQSQRRKISQTTWKQTKQIEKREKHPVMGNGSKFEKPAYSVAQLICMAIENSKHKKLSLSAICKWIRDNFAYYRNIEESLQNSVRLCLVGNGYFQKSSPNEASNKYLWEIKPKIYFGRPIFSQGGSKDMTPPNLPITNVDFLDSASNRKRKQVAPQKVIRRKNTKKRRNINENSSPVSPNLLEEEAPELGSLKGDFNWNSILDGLFPTSPGDLSLSANEEKVCNEFLTKHDGSMFAHNGFNDNVNKENGDNGLLPHLHEQCEDGYFPFTDTSTEETKYFKEFLDEKNELDLTVTGHQIEIPSEWEPVTSTLNDILCEKQDDNVAGFSQTQAIQQTDKTNHPWQEVENATDVIEDILMSTF